MITVFSAECAGERMNVKIRSEIDVVLSARYHRRIVSYRIGYDESLASNFSVPPCIK